LGGVTYEEALRRYKSGDKLIDDVRQGCYHPDTEILTPAGWKKVGDVGMDDEVAAAIPENGAIRIEWQKPTALQRYRSDKLVHLYCEGIDLRVTTNHRMLGFQPYDPSKVVMPEDFHKLRGWYNAGTAPGGTWDPDERLLRLAVATQADGSRSKHQIRFGFTKRRKIDRMRSLLEGVPHREEISKQGVTTFVLFGVNNYPSGNHTPDGLADEISSMLTDKMFDQRWLDLTDEKRRIVLDEITHWDAGSGKRSVSSTYYSIHKQNIDIVQALATMQGIKTRVSVDQANGKDFYKLSIRSHSKRKNDRSRGDNLKTTALPYDGDVVCVSVPATFVVVRDGGVPVVCGQSKIGNYGMSGGMGVDSFIDYARGYGVELERNRASEIHAAFRRKWREMPEYFNRCSHESDGPNGATAIHPRTNMQRGKVGYTALCNHYFQHLAAVGATLALQQAVREMYDPTIRVNGEPSPLYGCRSWLFCHDEIGMEIPYDAIGPERAHAAAMRLQTVMIESMKFYCPDVPIEAVPVMARRWLKGAKPVFMNGLLVPSKPQKDASGKTTWVADLDVEPRRAVA
jgi:hypothetical protein